MLETKTRNDILLEEKVAQIDDINFDKIYDVEEFATKQIEDFNEDFHFKDNDFISDVQEDATPDAVFEMEVSANEFLDNYKWESREEEKKTTKKSKLFVANKPLFFAFTSIAFLLGILLIYNVFVINSLSNNLKDATKLNVANMSTCVLEENEISFSKPLDLENFKL